MLIQVLFQYHEPSIRIFRGLTEMILLLLCTAVSIRVYVHYILPSSVVHLLLFQSIYYSRNGDNDEDDNDSREQNMERNDDQALFQPVNDDDDDDNTDRHENQKENDEYINLVKTDSDAADEMDIATATSLHQLSVSILSMALDLSLYTCITLILYLLSAIHALQQPSLSSATATTTSTNGDPSIAIWMAKIAAPTFPLLLFLFCSVRCIQSYQHYKQFYTILSYTIYAPFYNVTFRDGMIVSSNVLFSTYVEYVTNCILHMLNFVCVQCPIDSFGVQLAIRVIYLHPWYDQCKTLPLPCVTYCLDYVAIGRTINTTIMNICNMRQPPTLTQHLCIYQRSYRVAVI